ncbi:MAG: heme exporter protein [Rickettsiaceae bacterium]|jgi:heme exporter protein B|nr:heme exporter protein [Rickettsiaceae bacterium]
MIFSIIKQALILNIKNFSSLAHSLVFLLITSSIFAITTKISDTAIAIAIIWICLTFAILSASSNQFQKDFDDGSFEQLYLSGHVFEIIILAKIFANWLINIVPLIIFLPVIALILKIPDNLITDLILIASITSLLISFMVSFVGSLIISANTTSALLTILVLPLLIPIIILANAAFEDNFAFSIKFLSVLSVFLIPVLTFATAWAVRISLID